MKSLFSKRWVSQMVLISFIFTGSCTSFYPVEGKSPEQLSKTIYTGETVRVTKTNGDAYEFKVIRVTNDGIEGEYVKIAFDEIADIQTEETSPFKSLGLGLGIFGAYMLIPLAAILIVGPP